MAKITQMEGRFSGESLGEIETKKFLQELESGFVDYTNNFILPRLRTIQTTADVPRAGRLPHEDLDWKEQLKQFNSLRLACDSSVTTLKIRYPIIVDQSLSDKVAGYHAALKSFDPHGIQNPDMGEAIRALETYMEKFAEIRNKQE